MIFVCVCVICLFFLPDPKIKADVNRWRLKLDNYSSQELGKTIVYLNGSSQSCRFGECNMGNLICDAMVSGPQGRGAQAREGRRQKGRGTARWL